MSAVPQGTALVASGPNVSAVYLLFLDESGTHGGSPVFIVGGIALHEEDTRHLQGKLESFLTRKLSTPPLSLSALKFELHATDIKNRAKEWAVVPPTTAHEVMHGTYATIINFVASDATLPVALFGAVIEKRKVPDRRERERLAYELVLNKFDAMLGRLSRLPGASHQNGLVIHDQRVVHGGARAWTDERAIQEWTRDWREAAGKVGRLRHFADVPLFADSQASRLIQAADFVSYALWRHYGGNDGSFLSKVLASFDTDAEVLHGLIHVSNDFARRTCPCPPCQNRLTRGLEPDI